MSHRQDIANRLRSEASIVSSYINSVSDRYTLRETVATMKQAADILEKDDMDSNNVTSKARIRTRIRIVTELSDSLARKVNDVIDGLERDYQNLEIKNIEIMEPKTGTLRAVIVYQIGARTRS